MEGLLYDRVTTQRFVFLLRVKKWMKASWTMFVKYVFYQDIYRLPDNKLCIKAKIESVVTRDGKLLPGLPVFDALV